MVTSDTTSSGGPTRPVPRRRTRECVVLIPRPPRRTGSPAIRQTSLADNTPSVEAGLKVDHRIWLRTRRSAFRTAKEEGTLEDFQLVLWFDFRVCFPGFYNPPFPEEPDMVIRYNKAQGKTKGRFRCHFQVNCAFDLDAVGVSKGDSHTPTSDKVVYTIPPDEHFVHDAVGRFLEAYQVTSLERRFLAMGVYTHEDLVQLSLDIRIHERRQDFRRGVEVRGALWRKLKRALKEYARPVPGETPCGVEPSEVGKATLSISEPNSPAPAGKKVAKPPSSALWTSPPMERLTQRLTQRHILGPVLRRLPGSCEADMFKDFGSTAPVSPHAQRILQEQLRSLRPTAKGSDCVLSSEMRALLEPCDGLRLADLFVASGILTKADLVTVSLFAKHHVYGAVVRAALGVFVSDGNWTAFRRLGNYFLLDEEVYGDYFARQKRNKEACDAAEEWLANVSIPGVYHVLPCDVANCDAWDALRYTYNITRGLENL
ncbi:hypothetical protein BDZ89DRAFT_1036137 [Hymenopellis radicata]|nr:hypothetical protein BDZ89DRAFT_1036137 [Hymenopellis radicata]